MIKKTLLLTFTTLSALALVACGGSSGGGGGGGGGGVAGCGGGSTSQLADAIATGSGHTCALMDDATVKCWGANSSGQLGQCDTENRGDESGEMGDNLNAVDLGTGHTAIAIATGWIHNCALLDDASIKCWGNNTNGQLGLGDTANRGDQSGEMGDNLDAVDLGTGRTAVAITANAYNTCALLDDASVKCWGDNRDGQLGQGDTEHRGDQSGEMGDNLNAIDLGTGRTAVAITSGNYSTCALLDNATVKCWGNNYGGGLGQGDAENRGDESGEMGDNLSAINLGVGRTAVAISAGGGHTCALLDDASVKCWGINNFGQLGQGDLVWRSGANVNAIDLGIGRTALVIVAGAGDTCVLLDNASIKCWGLNRHGRLGQGDTADRGDQIGEMGDNLNAIELGTGRTGISIAAGSGHTCSLLDNAQVKCWGLNDYGKLGLGDTENRGDESGEMGDNLLPVEL